MGVGGGTKKCPNNFSPLAKISTVTMNGTNQIYTTDDLKLTFEFFCCSVCILLHLYGENITLSLAILMTEGHMSARDHCISEVETIIAKLFIQCLMNSVGKEDHSKIGRAFITCIVANKDVFSTKKQRCSYCLSLLQ